MQVNRKRVERLMREEGLQGIYRRKGRRNLVNAATGEDLVRRQFTAQAPDRLWLTDITEHPAADGKLYCAAVMDAYSRRIIGWSIDKRQDTDLVAGALAMAVTRRQPGGDSTILHSDHGAQGEFNWSSHHLDHGGVRWDGGSRCRRRRRVLGGSGRRIGRCGRRCGHRAALSRLVRCSGSSGG